MHSSNTTYGTSPREQVVLRVRAHGRRLLLPSLFLVAGATATGYWAGTFSEAALNIAAWVGFALIVLLWCAAVVRWLTSRVVMTQRRLIIKRGVFVQHSSEVSFAKIREVRTRRTILQRVFGSGQVILLTGADPAVVLRDVAQCDVVCDALRELIDHFFEESQHSFDENSPNSYAANPSHLNQVSDTRAQSRFTPEQAAVNAPNPDFAPTVAVRPGRAGYDNGRIVRRPRITPNERDASL